MSKGEQTRQHIIACAADVFSMRGFFGTSMRDLTDATGIEKGGIYNHFSSKEALAIESFDYATNLIAQRFVDVLEGKEKPLERLVAIVEVFYSLIDDPVLTGGCPVLNTAVESDDTYPVLRERAQRAMTSWHKLIGREVKAGVAQGELKPDSDPYMVATVVTATLEGAIMLSKLYDDSIYIRRAVDHMVDYIRSLAL